MIKKWIWFKGLLLVLLLMHLHAEVVMYGTTVSNTMTDPKPNPGTAECIECHNQDLRKDHPSSIEYLYTPQNRASLRPVTTPLYNWVGASTVSDLLVNGKVECISCHYVHSNPLVNTVGDLFLRAQTTQELCMGCHSK